MPGQTDARAVERQTRRYIAVGNGHTSVDVVLEQTPLSPRWVLADIEPPLLGVLGGRSLKSVNREASVRCRKVGHGYRYVLEDGTPASGPTRWSWRYSVAPGLHASHRETAHCDRDERGPFSVCDHLLRIPSRLLELNLTVASPIGLAEPFAEGPQGPVDWGEVRGEVVTFEKAALLTVHDPILGYRYGIRYRFTHSSAVPTDDVAKTCELVLRACLLDRAVTDKTASGLRTGLNHAINCALTQGEQIGGDSCLLAPAAAWKALLWEPKRQELVTCFGEFASEHWLARYRLGEGVAGQCFRTCLPTGYVRSTEDNREFTADRQGQDDDWMFCIPLTAGEGAAAVGVVLFSGRFANDGPSHALEQLANDFDVLSGHRPSRRLIHDLSWIVNGNFWTAVAELEVLEESSRRVARSLASSYKGLGGSDQQSTVETRGAEPPATQHSSESMTARPRAALSARAPAVSPVARSLSSAPPSSMERTPTDFVESKRRRSGPSSTVRTTVAGTIATAVIGLLGTIYTLERGARNATPEKDQKEQQAIAENKPAVSDGQSKLDKLRSALQMSSPSQRPDLHDFDLRGLTLDKVDFRGANLRNANLSGSSLVECFLRQADLRGANLDGADLRAAKLQGATYDLATKFPGGFFPPDHELVAAVSALVPSQESPGSRVKVLWTPRTEWMIVRWFDATGACRSGESCRADYAIAQQAPVELSISPGAVEIRIFRKGDSVEAASRSFDVR